MNLEIRPDTSQAAGNGVIKLKVSDVIVLSINAHIFICLSACLPLSVCPSICLLVCLSVCLWFGINCSMCIIIVVASEHAQLRCNYYEPGNKARNLTSGREWSAQVEG